MTYYVLSLSGGKDSTAMLLHCLEIGQHIDEVITCDTGLEFPAMYEHLDKLAQIIKDAKIKYTVLKNKETFEYMMLEKPIKSEKYGEHIGLGWPSNNARWCTKYLKTELLKKYVSQLKKEHGEVIQYIGLAYDETKRLAREWNKKEGKEYPLVSWGWTEKDALDYCYKKGFDWGGLYRQFKRVSCWACPLQPIEALRTLWEYYPELWHKLEVWEIKQIHEGAGRGGLFWFKSELTVFDLTARFAIEKKRELIGLSNRKKPRELETIIKELPKGQTTLKEVA